MRQTTRLEPHLRDMVGGLSTFQSSFCHSPRVETCPLDTLHAVSAIGTRLAFYSLDARNPRAAIVPAAIPRDPERVNDTAPVRLWAHDVLEAEGEAQLRAVVAEIKAGAEVL